MSGGRVFLANAFSLGMLNSECTLKIKEISVDEVRDLLMNGFENAIGHMSTSVVLSKLLGIQVNTERREIKLNHGDRVIVFQLLKRLEEGKVLTEEEIKNIPHKFYLVIVE